MFVRSSENVLTKISRDTLLGSTHLGTHMDSTNHRSIKYSENYANFSYRFSAFLELVRNFKYDF